VVQKAAVARMHNVVCHHSDDPWCKAGFTFGYRRVAVREYATSALTAGSLDCALKFES